MSMQKMQGLGAPIDKTTQKQMKGGVPNYQLPHEITTFMLCGIPHILNDLNSMLALASCEGYCDSLLNGLPFPDSCAENQYW
jgi:hypothetical protein